MDRLRELEIRIEKFKNKLEDIEAQLSAMRLDIGSLRRVEPNNWAAWLMLVYLSGSNVGELDYYGSAKSRAYSTKQ